MSEKWRIEQLAKLAEQALGQADYDGQLSGRVRDVPDVRTIRYYITLGLLDRPLEMQGRTAFYGPKHLLQLVAIKRLQAQGLPLVDVQQQMLGIGPKKLATLAAMPEGFFDAPLLAKRSLAAKRSADDSPERLDSGGKTATALARSRRAFWSELPQLPSTPEGGPVAGGPLPAVILPLAEGVSLLIEGVDPARLSRQALAALAAAGANVREVLGREVLGSAKLIEDASRPNAGEPDASETAAPPQPQGE
jgi:DNA-binding transcriptional MerR regulator